METLDELFELADVLGGVVGFGREDDGRTYQPPIVVILQSTRSTLARLQLGDEAVMIDLDDLRVLRTPSSALTQSEWVGRSNAIRDERRRLDAHRALLRAQHPRLDQPVR